MAWYNPTKMGTIRFTENTITSFKNTESCGISVYPNPSADNVLIQSQQQFDEVLIYSVHGQLMYSQEDLSATGISLDIRNFKPGIYILKVAMKDGTGVNQILVKQAR
jgi:hypothetical protein